MTAFESASHPERVQREARFSFGKNWKSFLKKLTVPRIRLAEASLRDALGIERLDGLTFLDIGSGSGLFSLAARRLGAQVTSFDYDQDSVQCTKSLRERYFRDDANWRVEQGSALDDCYLTKLGTFDIVYSWGVLHHTGDMWQALRLVMPKVKLGGILFISLYNDQGEATDRWAAIKRRYNALPRPLAFAYALVIIVREETKQLTRQLFRGVPGDWLRTWTQYDLLSTRGMSRWHDWIDWIGGYPYQRVRIEPVVDFCSRDGLALVHIVDRSTGYGCNEFVFRRLAQQGTQVESIVPNSASMARRIGIRIWPPFDRDASGWTARVQELPKHQPGSSLFLVRDDVLHRDPQIEADGRVRIAAPEVHKEELENSVLHLVVAEDRSMARPYNRRRGKLFEASAPDLSRLADSDDEPSRSPVFVFENDRQLPMPHAVHDEIATYGAGRFSHWGASIFFSSVDGSDPNANGRRYRLLLPPQPIPAERSLVRSFGLLVPGPFSRGRAGWTADLKRPGGDRLDKLFLLTETELIGEAPWDEDGQLIVAPPTVQPASLTGAEFWLIQGDEIKLKPPFDHVRGNMWVTSVPHLRSIADEPGRDRRSPVFLFEDGQQLPHPHALHDEIDRIGRGRFSHWESSLYFSPLDKSDPNNNGRAYRAVIARWGTSSPGPN